LSLFLVACGSGNSSGDPVPVTPVPPAVSGIDKADAYRFLNQASFGATENSAAELIESGYESWIEKQMQLPASSQLPH
jgi:hypothetical protein